MAKGGKQPGAGRPKGRQNSATISANEQKALAREVIRAHISQHIPAIIAANVDNAKGVCYMVLRDASGAYVRATDEAAVDEALKRMNDGDTSVMRVYTKEP